MIGVHIGAGLCNRLFQICYAYSLARKHNLMFRFENWEQRSHHSVSVYEWLIKRFMALPNYFHTTTPIPYSVEIKEGANDFTSYIDRYDARMQEEPYWIYGFFQNELYFKEYRADLLELLREPEYVSQVIAEKYTDLLPVLENAYFLHVRLGDYVGHPKHWVHLENYYLKVLESLPSGCGIVVFSNQWGEVFQRMYPLLFRCLQEREGIAVIEPDEVVCLYLMKRCRKGGICSNSTFGWWGAWLNEALDKQVYFPSQWMRDASFKCEIYPGGSIVVDV